MHCSWCVLDCGEAQYQSASACGTLVGMAKRKFRIVHETPQLGVCEYCNMQFSAVTPLGTPNKATIKEQFNVHKCKREDFSQAAARTVREATENK